VDIKLFILTVVIVHWILNFVDLPTHENHENWYLTNGSDFTVSIYDIHLLGSVIITSNVVSSNVEKYLSYLSCYCHWKL